MLCPWYQAGSLNAVYVYAGRLRWVFEYLSHASFVGLMAGASLTTALAQIPHLLGYTHGGNSATDVISTLQYIFSSTSQVPTKSFRALEGSSCELCKPSTQKGDCYRALLERALLSIQHQFISAAHILAYK